MGTSKTQIEPLALGKKTSKKSFNSANEKLVCHQAVIDAFLAWNAIKKSSVKHDALSKQIIHLHIRSAPKISVIAADTSSTSEARQTLYFINNFSTVQQLVQLEIDKLPMATVSEPDIEAIVQAAWFEVVNLMFSSLDPKHGWASYRDVINQNMPKYLINLFFGTDSITVDLLLKLSGMEMRTYERMRASYREEHPIIHNE